MRITIPTMSYNDRRYGKPWVAKVDFTDPKGTFTFGNWIGATGERGELVVEAESGDIIAQGQKDSRKSHKSAPSFYQVNADGSLGDELTKVDAYHRWQEQQTKRAVVEAPAPTETGPDLSQVSVEALTAELRRRGITSL